VRIPDWISWAEAPTQIHAFCRTHDWKVWVKGAAYEAHRAETWEDVRRAARHLEEVWGTPNIHLQQNIRGWEVSVVFAAWEGRLLDAVFMEKRLLTESGKTWAGAVSDLSTDWSEALGDLVAALRWSGGAELEFVRDPAGDLWLMDWNPRFPAWVHAVTLAGRNLPACLVEAASGIAALPAPVLSRQFTRVVVELPVREGFALPPPPPVKPERAQGGKHPSGMPLMMRRLDTGRTKPPSSVRGSVPDTLLADILQVMADGTPTPFRAILPETSRRRFARLAALQDLRPHPDVDLRVAYSCKTNPSTELLRLTRENGLWAEVISMQELEWIRAHGFGGEKIIYNGPVPLTSEVLGPESPLRAVFADSLEALRKYRTLEHVDTIGVRLRPPFVDSRFGIDVETFEEFDALRQLLATFPPERSIGLSFHIQSSRIGLDAWHALLPVILDQAVAFESLTGRAVAMLDIGGGHHPDDFVACFAPGFGDHIREMQKWLPALTEIVLEPGKAAAEPCGVIVASIVELRRRGAGHREAVLDASVAEVPLIDAFPHRMIALSGERAEFLCPGDDRVFGRLCMESDVLMPRADLPDWLREGDQVVICDCGGYDASMAYPFGKGEPRGFRSTAIP